MQKLICTVHPTSEMYKSLKMLFNELKTLLLQDLNWKYSLYGALDALHYLQTCENDLSFIYKTKLVKILMSL
jgi:Tfp pilus assembly protein PilO